MRRAARDRQGLDGVGRGHNTRPDGTRKTETDVEVAGGPSIRKSKSRRHNGREGVWLGHVGFRSFFIPLRHLLFKQALKWTFG